jgi:hypothetical protein
MPPEQKHLRITLVPGTWAYGLFGSGPRAPASPPRWFEENSEFRNRLDEALTKRGFSFTTEVLEWDCANSVRSRAAQAEALAKRLEAQRGEGGRSVVIAHSHGGNIACKAAGSIAADTSDLAIVTLSTPFLRAEERHEQSPRVLLVVLFILLAFLCFGAFEFPTGEAAVGPALWNYARGALLALPLMAVYLWFANSDPEAMSRMVNFPRVANAKVLVLRGFSDEAGAAIVLGSIGTGVMNTFLYVLALPLRQAMDSRWGLHLLGLLYAVGLVAFFLNATAIFRVVDIWYVIGILFVSLAGPVAFAGAFSSLFGREMFFQCLNLALTVDSAPDAAGVADIVTLPVTQTSAEGLRHGIYNHPRTAPTIANWLYDGVPRPLVTNDG